MKLPKIDFYADSAHPGLGGIDWERGQSVQLSSEDYREIVHRCNVHDDLVAALELAIGAMYIDGRRGQRTYESVRAALKKAKGA